MHRALQLKRTLAHRRTQLLLASKGWRLIRRSMGPTPFLQTTGHRTGALPWTPVVYLRDPGDVAVIPATGGSDAVPSWRLDRSIAGTDTVVIHESRAPVALRVAQGVERDGMQEACSANHSTHQDYLAPAGRDLPVEVLGRIR